MKTAISIPDKIFKAAEKLAKARGMKRSHLYRLALEEYLDRECPSGVTSKINRFIAKHGQIPLDPAVAEAARRMMLSVEWDD
jgi:hypothetical protein